MANSKLEIATSVNFTVLEIQSNLAQLLIVCSANVEGIKTLSNNQMKDSLIEAINSTASLAHKDAAAQVAKIETETKAKKFSAIIDATSDTETAVKLVLHELTPCVIKCVLAVSTTEALLTTLESYYSECEGFHIDF